MKKVLCALLALALVLALPFSAAAETFSTEDFTMEIPEGTYVFTPTTSTEDPNWAMAGVANPESELSTLAEMNGVAELVTEDGETTILVQQQESDQTQAYFNLRYLTEGQQADFLDAIMQSQTDEITVDKYYLDVDGQPFYRIRIDGTYQETGYHELIYGTIVNGFVSEGVDLIIPIATPAATAAAAAVQGTDIPLVYSAVTDPVGAQLADSMDAPGQNMTGTSDYIDTNKILDLALAADPDLKTLGLIYNLGETNSVTTIENMKPVLEEKGITAVESTVTNAGEVQMAAQNLLAQGAEAIFVPIDNTVADGMAVLATTAIEAGVPVYTAADSLVRDGGLATTGVNYTKLGELTAQMAVDVLNGADPAATPVQVLNDGITTVNTTTAAALGIDPGIFDLTGEGYIAVE